MVFKMFPLIDNYFYVRVIQLMEYQKNQKRVHKKFVIQILLKVLDILTALPSLVDEEIPS